MRLLQPTARKHGSNGSAEKKFSVWTSYVHCLLVRPVRVWLSLIWRLPRFSATRNVTTSSLWVPPCPQSHPLSTLAPGILNIRVIFRNVILTSRRCLTSHRSTIASWCRFLCDCRILCCSRCNLGRMRFSGKGLCPPFCWPCCRFCYRLMLTNAAS